MFKTKVSRQQEYGLKLTTGGEYISIPFVGSYDVNVTDSDDVVTNYTGTGTFILDGVAEIHIKLISGTHDSGWELFDFNQTSGSIVQSQSSSLICTLTGTPSFELIIPVDVFSTVDYANLGLFNSAQNGDINNAKKYVNGSNVGTTLTGFPMGLTLDGGVVTTTLTTNTVGLTQITNLTANDIDASGASGDVLILNCEVNDVTG